MHWRNFASRLAQLCCANLVIALCASTVLLTPRGAVSEPLPIVELSGIQFKTPLISQSDIVYEVHFTISNGSPFEFSGLRVYVFDPSLGELRLLRTTGLMHSSQKILKTSPQSVDGWNVLAGNHTIGTSVQGGAPPSPSVATHRLPLPSIERGHVSGEYLWCLEILPAYSERLSCIVGPKENVAEEEAIKAALLDEEVREANLKQLSAATQSSPGLCKFASATIVETVAGITQCNRDCHTAHSISSEPYSPDQSSPLDRCRSECSRVSTEQLGLVIKSFTVCEGLVSGQQLCAFAMRFMEQCGRRTTVGCQELGSLLAIRCRDTFQQDPNSDFFSERKDSH